MRLSHVDDRAVGASLEAVVDGQRQADAVVEPRRDQQTSLWRELDAEGLVEGLETVGAGGWIVRFGTLLQQLQVFVEVDADRGSADVAHVQQVDAGGDGHVVDAVVDQQDDLTTDVTHDDSRGAGGHGVYPRNGANYTPFIRRCPDILYQERFLRYNIGNHSEVVFRVKSF